MADLDQTLRIAAWRGVQFMKPLPWPLKACEQHLHEAERRGRWPVVHEAPPAGAVDLHDAVRAKARPLASAKPHPLRSLCRRARLAVRRARGWLMAPMVEGA